MWQWPVSWRSGTTPASPARGKAIAKPPPAAAAAGSRATTAAAAASIAPVAASTRRAAALPDVDAPPPQ